MWHNVANIPSFVPRAVSVPAGSRNSPASVSTDNAFLAGSRKSPASVSADSAFPAGSRNRPASILAGRTFSTGWKNHAAGPMTRPTSHYFQHFSRPGYYNQIYMNEGRWGTAENPHKNKDLGIIDSGCSQSMTGNKEKLDDFVKIIGGTTTFGGGDGKITGKSTIRTSKLNFENEFQLPENNQVVLRVPRRHNLYSFNLTEIQPERDINCLLAKASSDESTKWHRRMAHVNFKNINKLAKHGLVNGLPSKLFTNEHNCVACNKGKQHKASYKAITAVSTISEPLQLLHMDLFGPTSIRSIDHKYYSLVVTDDLSRKVPNISHLKPFGCHVTILNTSDHLGKFGEKLMKGLGQEWYFDLDYLTDSLGYTRFKSNQPTGPKVYEASEMWRVFQYMQNETCRLKDKNYESQRSAENNFYLVLLNHFYCYRTVHAVKLIPPVLIGSSDHYTRFPSPSDLANSYPHVFRDGGIYTIPSTILRDLTSPVQTIGTLKKSKFGESTFVSYVHDQQRNNHTDYLHFVKALYGLHQAPRAWYARLSTFLLKHNYRRGTIDKTLFIKKNSRDIILVQVYVDDIIFGSTKKAWDCKLSRSRRDSLSAKDKYVQGHGLRKFDIGKIHDRFPHVFDSFKADIMFVANPKLGSIVPEILLCVGRSYKWTVSMLVHMVIGKSKLVDVIPGIRSGWLSVSSGGARVPTGSFTSSYWLTTSYWYALTHDPIIFDSLVKQFWSTASLRDPELGPPAILVTIDRTPYTISEDTVRSQLQLGDDEGIEDLPIADIYLGDHMPLLAAMLPPAQAAIADEGANESDPDLFTSTNVEDETLGGSFHTTPPRSTPVPPVGPTSGGAEDLATLTALSYLVSELVHKVSTLESELKTHKLLFKDVVGQLVKKVKALELNLKTRSRKDAAASDAHVDVSPGADIPPSPPLLTNMSAGVSSGVSTGAPTGPSTVSPSSTTVPTSSSVPAAETIPASSEPTPTHDKTFKQLEEKRLGWETAQRLQAQELADFEKQRVESLMKDANLARQMSQYFKMTEDQRKRHQEVLASAANYSDAAWDIILAPRMVALVNTRRKELAEQWAKE
ncbi:ribonuclease H-like domain-containing protein [Tanacetum coccineum]